MPRFDTGLTSQDAQDDFNRARRQRVLSRLANRLRGEPSDFNVILPFEEVVEALGYVGEADAGLTTIPLDSILGTVGRTQDFDRSFRPTSGRPRRRWERIAGAQRRGESMPPISVYRIGELHFVRDGHHRVSVARARGDTVIDAYVTEVRTRLGADRKISLGDLPVKGHERLFAERVPLPPEARAKVRLSDPWRYGELAEGVEAWGFRAMQDRREFLTREQVAEAWYRDEYLPVVAMLREADLIGRDTEADAYVRVAAERYRLMRTHEWSDEVLERLRRELR
jgi:hypothetical protein